VSSDDVPERLKKGLARHSVLLMLLMLLVRLAASRTWQGKGVGAGLLKDTIQQTLQAVDIVGIRTIAIHAKNDTIGAFYEHFGFLQSPTDPLHLFVLTKDLQRMTLG
jgi:GNAT superfamily N-acetyltransferase